MGCGAPGVLPDERGAGVRTARSRPTPVAVARVVVMSVQPRAPTEPGGTLVFQAVARDARDPGGTAQAGATVRFC